MDKFVVRNHKLAESDEPSASRSSQLSIQLEDGISANTAFCTVAEKKGRNFQNKWQVIFLWLLYNGDIDKVVCQICKEAASGGVSVLKKSTRYAESVRAFSEYGYSSWNKALERFKKHEISEIHRFYVLYKAYLEHGIDIYSTQL